MWAVIRLRTFRARSRRHAKKMRKTKSERHRNLERQFGSRSPTKNKFLSRIYWALRGCQYWLCFYDDEVEVDLEDLLSNPFNTQPPPLDQLEKLTGFNRQWLMFLYRNFKQRCSNGRMSESQWRGIFRLLFPNAIDYAFADRLFAAITVHRGHQQITFEDLVLCLFDLTESAKVESKELSVAVSAANFAFNLMGPDDRGRVTLSAFTLYTRSVFDLCSSRNSSCENAAQLGLPTGSIHRNKEEVEKPISPLIERFARERFMAIDKDGDGFILLSDVEREFGSAGEEVCLRSTREFEQMASCSRIY